VVRLYQSGGCTTRAELEHFSSNNGDPVEIARNLNEKPPAVPDFPARGR
jgi:hypothetical protein